MRLHQFTLVVDSEPTDDQIDRLLQTENQPGVTNSPRTNSGEVQYDIRGDGTLTEAIAQGIHEVESVGLRPVRVLGEDWVTLGEIAERIGRSREAVRLWAAGKVGPGGFPPVLNPHRDPDTSFYSWAEVGPWLRERMGLDIPDEEPVLVAANLALQLRALAPRISQMSVLRDLIPG
jgi:hypothetical protein